MSKLNLTEVYNIYVRPIVYIHFNAEQDDQRGWRNPTLEKRGALPPGGAAEGLSEASLPRNASKLSSHAVSEVIYHTPNFNFYNVLFVLSETLNFFFRV